MFISTITHPALTRHFLNAYHAAQGGCAEPSTTADEPVNTYAPAVEIRETAQAFELSAELPGVKREQITIEMDGAHLVLTAERTRPAQPDAQTTTGADRVLTSERRFGKLVRRFKVGEAIDRDALQAKLEDGVLTLVLPKKAENAARRVVIQ